jgi:hypothetical protein
MLTIKVERAPARPSYPRLKISDVDQIVLFTAEGEGTLLHPGKSSLDKGRHSTSWPEHRYVDFYGSITLLETRE